MSDKLISREDYVQGKATHEQYYGQFVTKELKQAVIQQFGIETLLASKDPYFNDIPLARWDAMSQTFGGLVNHKKIHESQGHRGWSLCTVVCLTKEAARQIREEHLNQY